MLALPIADHHPTISVSSVVALMLRPQFNLKTLLWLMALMATFFGGTSFRWRELDALRRDLNHQRSVVRSLKESNSHLAAKFNEANRPVMYRGISIQRVVPRFNDTRPSRYSCIGNGHIFRAESLEEAIELIDRSMRLQAHRADTQK